MEAASVAQSRLSPALISTCSPRTVPSRRQEALPALRGSRMGCLSEAGSPPSPPRSASPGLERDKFDNKTVSFEEHIKFEHNMWNYLYFIVLVRVKNKTDYTGPESYVAQMIKVRAWGARGTGGRLWTFVQRQQVAGSSWSWILWSPPTLLCCSGGASGKSLQRVQVVSGARGCPVPGDPACGDCSVALSEGPFLLGARGRLVS